MIFGVDSEIAAAIDAGDLFACSRCREVSDGNHCATCHEGACCICGDLVKKGQPHTRDPQFPKDIFCTDPRCGDIASELSVADLAARLASGGAS